MRWFYINENVRQTVFIYCHRIYRMDVFFQWNRGHLFGGERYHKMRIENKCVEKKLKKLEKKKHVLCAFFYLINAI